MDHVQSNPNPRIPIPRIIRLFLILSTVLTALCAASELLCRYILGLTASVYTQPLFVGLSFMDFDCYSDNFLTFHTADFFSIRLRFPFAYPAAMAPLYAFFMQFQPQGLNVFLGVCAFLTAALTTLLGIALHRKGLGPWNSAAVAASTLLLSYPFWFVFERANVELFVFFFLAAGVIAIVCEKPILAAILLGVAGSMKFFPIIYLGLLFSRRQYRAVALGLATAALCSLLSFWYIGPTFMAAFHGIERGMKIFHDVFLLQPRPVEFGFDHSLYGFYRRFFPLPSTKLLSPALSAYMVTTAMGGTFLYLARIRFLPLINQVLCLAVAAILLPPASFDYTLIHLYVPLALILVLAADLRSQCHSAWRIPGLPAIVATLALLTSPESELIWHGFRIAAQFKCLLLVLLFVLALRYPIEPTQRRRRQPRAEAQTGSHTGPQLVLSR